MCAASRSPVTQSLTSSQTPPHKRTHIYTRTHTHTRQRMNINFQGPASNINTYFLNKHTLLIFILFPAHVHQNVTPLTSRRTIHSKKVEGGGGGGGGGGVWLDPIMSPALRVPFSVQDGRERQLIDLPLRHI